MFDSKKVIEAASIVAAASLPLAGKVVFIFGGSSGMGKATAKVIPSLLFLNFVIFMIHNIWFSISI